MAFFSDVASRRPECARRVVRSSCALEPGFQVNYRKVQPRYRFKCGGVRMPLRNRPAEDPSRLKRVNLYEIVVPGTSAEAKGMSLTVCKAEPNNLEGHRNPLGKFLGVPIVAMAST